MHDSSPSRRSPRESPRIHAIQIPFTPHRERILARTLAAAREMGRHLTASLGGVPGHRAVPYTAYPDGRLEGIQLVVGNMITKGGKRHTRRHKTRRHKKN